MELRPGLRLRSVACDSEVIVVRVGSGGLLSCGGHPMVEAGVDVVPATLADEQGTVLGKRYSDQESGVEVLCTKPGRGGLSVDGRALSLKAAKPLTASD